VQLCRSLKTYGITCFEVLEKPTRGKKWQPILLGITKDNIYRMDINTKEIIKTNKVRSAAKWCYLFLFYFLYFFFFFVLPCLTSAAHGAPPLGRFSEDLHSGLWRLRDGLLHRADH
jgi:hypothetical protein